MQDIALIILDECHHAKRKHPYAVIFDTYYRSTPPEERPRVFGMTASPIVGKQDIQAGLLQLQNALNCRVITCDESEISAYVSRAAERIVWYPPEQTMSSFPLYEEFCKWSARLDALYPESTGSGQPPKMFRKIATDTGDIIVSLGTAAADAFLRDTIPELKKWARRWKTKSKGKMMVLDEGFRLIEPSFLEPTPPELLTDSAKVRTLIAELRQQMEQPEYCGIIFVERRCTAWALGAILRREFGKTVGIIVGHGSGGALEESVGGQQMDYKLQNEVIRKVGCFRPVLMRLLGIAADGYRQFRKGEITTLVATSVAEEGLDIKPCMLVVRLVSIHGR